MATRDSREVIIEAPAGEILDVIADVESAPEWSPQYQRVEILETYPDGRPKQAKMTVKAAGLTDAMVVEYTWSDSGVSWTLVAGGGHSLQICSIRGRRTSLKEARSA